MALKAFIFLQAGGPAPQRQAPSGFAFANGESLLARQLRVLHGCGVEETVVFGGGAAGLPADAPVYPSMPVVFAAAGEDAARHGLLKNGGLVLSGEMVYGAGFIRALLGGESPDVMTVESVREGQGARLFARLDMRFAAAVGRTLAGPGVWACLPAAKLGPKSAAALAPFLPTLFGGADDGALDAFAQAANAILAGREVKYLRSGPPCAPEDARRAYGFRMGENNGEEVPFALRANSEAAFSAAKTVLQGLDAAARCAPEQGGILRLFGMPEAEAAPKPLVVCDETYGGLPLGFLLTHYGVEHALFAVGGTDGTRTAAKAGVQEEDEIAATEVFAREGCGRVVSIGGAGAVCTAAEVARRVSRFGEGDAPVRHTALPLCTGLFAACCAPPPDEVLVDGNLSLWLGAAAVDDAYAACLHAAALHVLHSAARGAPEEEVRRALWAQSAENVFAGLEKLLRCVPDMLNEVRMSAKMFGGMCAVLLGVGQWAAACGQASPAERVLAGANGQGLQNAAAFAALWPELLQAAGETRTGFAHAARCGAANAEEADARVREYAATVARRGKLE